MAVKAGADQLLQPLPRDVVPMIDALVAAVERGEITEARIDASVRKLLIAKQSVGLDRQRLVRLEDIPRVINKTEHMERAQTTAERSITAVRHKAGTLPLKPGTKIVSIIYADDYDPFTGRTFNATLTAAIPTVRAILLDATSDSARIARASAAIDSADVVLFSPFIRVTASKGGLNIPARIAALIQKTATRKPTVVTAFGNPYILGQFPTVENYLIAWSQWDISQRAAARALTGQAPITGRLPIAIPPYHRIGEGVDIKP
jgi:beta-N-acetylhexosaminidase